MTQPTGGFQIKQNDFPDGIKTPADVARLGQIMNPRLAELRKLTANGTSISDNIDCDIKSFQVRFTDYDWIPPTFTNGWTNASGITFGTGPAEYRLSEDGNIEIHGAVAGGSVGTSIFTLPTAFRPSVSRFFITTGSTGGTLSVAARVIVGADGTLVAVTIGAGALDNTFLGLDGIRFASKSNQSGIYPYPQDVNPPVLASVAAGGYNNPGFPVTLRVKDGKTPKGILLLSCQDHASGNAASTPNTGPSTPAVLCEGVKWSNSRSGSGPTLVSIDAIPGLALGRTYDVTVLVLY